MKHKRLLLILGGLAAVLLAGYGTLRLTAPRPKLTLENIEAIDDGMTEQEVEKILGRRPETIPPCGTPKSQIYRYVTTS
jgi:hypothetical protein